MLSRAASWSRSSVQGRDDRTGPDRCHQIVATLEASAPRGTCPSCGTWSAAVHSHDPRTIADLPWGGQTVRLHLRVRKFFCRQPTCSRRIFTARLPHMVAPYARRMARLASVRVLLASALSGEPGARLVDRLGMPTSPATLLRLMRRTMVTERPAPTALRVRRARAVRALPAAALGGRLSHRSRLFREIQLLGYQHSARSR